MHSHHNKIVLTVSDLVHIDFTNQLTQAGIAYTIRKLVGEVNYSDSITCDQLRLSVTEIATELAFRRHLSINGIPHDSKTAQPFTKPNHQSLFIGGRKCEIISYLIQHRETIHTVRKDSNLLLQTSVQVPTDLFMSNHISNQDLLIFSFATGLVTTTQDELERAQKASQPTYCIHLLPKLWSHPSSWRSLGQLIVSANATEPVTVEMTGLGKSREYINEQLYLHPRQKASPKTEFYALNLIHNNRCEGAGIDIYSPTVQKAYQVARNNWDNIWVYGMDIILTGFITFGEFKRLAQPLKTSKQFSSIVKSPSRSVALKTKKLHSLIDLFQSASDWAARY